jgi:hypothetical protein
LNKWLAWTIIGALVALVIYLWFRPSPWKTKYNEVAEAYNKKLSDYNRLVDACNAQKDTCITKTNIVIKRNNVKVKVNNEKIRTIRDTLMMRCDTIWADSVRFENLDYLEVIPDMPDFEKVFDKTPIKIVQYNNSIGLSVSYTDKWHYGVAYERKFGRMSAEAALHYPLLVSVNLKFSFR